MDPEQEPEIGIDQLIQALPLSERVPAVALKALFDQRNTLDEEQETQLEVVRRKYADKIKPLLDRAAELIQGSTPLKEEVAAASQYLKPGQKLGTLKGKIIEGYWNGALQNSALEPYITEKDQRALEYLLNIQIVNEPEDPFSMSFKFSFKFNPYFNETTAVRKLKVVQGRAIALEGDVLTPKPGNWLTHETKKANNKSTGENKVMQGKKIDSFFDIFLNWTLVDNPEQLQKCAKIFQELGIVVRQSFSFFLGLYELNESEEQEDEYQQDEQSDSEGKKKKK